MPALSDYTRRKIRRQYDNFLLQWVTRSYQAFQSGEVWQPAYRFHEAEEDFRPKVDNLPAAIQEAFRYYLEHVENADWGNVRVRKVPTLPVPTIALRITTDGDDGWLEVYTLEGQRIGVGRTYIELVEWGPTLPLRHQTDSGAFFASFQARFSNTIWGK